MEIKNYDSKEVIQLLATAFADNAIVPVIGAGFTCGCLLKNGKRVPNGEAFKRIMISELTSNGSINEEQAKKLEKAKFSNVSSLFFEPEYVSNEKVKSILKEYFHNVILDSDRNEFINNINWPYLYTLNIDDAIENHANYKVVLPFNQVSDKSRHNKTLYKMHGDINYEINHDDSRVIFSATQYFQSIEKNQHLLSIIKSDFSNKNIMYIGCSLDDELELSFITANTDKNKEPGNFNIIFTCEEIDIIKKQELKTHGIDYVITYEKDQHHQIYKTINKAYSKSLEDNPEYEEFTKKVKRLDEEPNINEDFLIKGIVEINDRNDNRIIPYYAEKRDTEETLIKKINSEPLIIVEGRKFSGRTQLIYSCSTKIPNKEVFIVDSKYIIDKFNAKKLIERENAVIFFDSGSIDEEICYEIKRKTKSISDKNSCVVVVLDKSNIRCLDILQPDVIDSTPIVQLINKLSKKETERINPKAYDVKIPKFQHGQSILQNIYNAYDILGENTYISNITLDTDLFKVLYLIGIQDASATGESLIQSGLTTKEIKSIVDKFKPFIEAERVNRYEVEEHSGFKVTCHSKAWIYSLLRRYYIEKPNFCVENITKILLDLKKKNSSLFVKGLLFDTINELFSGDRRQGAGKGAGNLILELYDQLEESISNEPEFHVQRSKAYYNIFSDRNETSKIDSVIRNLKFSKTYSTSESTERNIKNQLALIHLKKCYLSNSIDKNLFEETINYCYRCIHDEAVNSRYVKELLSGNSRGGDYLNKFLNSIDNNPTLKLLALSMNEEYDFIKNRMKEFKSQEYRDLKYSN
ncbi:SIR2 family protein [Vibrio parahaemolyticus]|uniref:SIR2 family protein n=1 Tax=Vibrio parahaemolyticus TaxID=670 RepID=UPI0022DDBFEC|nr:SIR2 family protein [Vibrio parahaemolyticus]MDA0389115.1 SIR2 family protein [Vibrio parahaemolyticus]MDA0393029.1 SIR2 family protein [Vibrio parahaemolyticus]MDA0398217.1 SIR2 family protein [Vibrio parahaemolyticus]MDA0402761.1 SIR2 family protein [Vibrio parahaemolyticus]